MAEVIHKINITPEAKADIFESIGFEVFDWRALKNDTEEYITHMAASGRLSWRGYFRCDYADEAGGMRLKLFFYKGMHIGPMQYWDLKGVCESSDWSQDAEDDGLIRVWLETKIEDLPDEEDWAIRVRVKKIIDTALTDVFDETKKTFWEDVVREVKNEFECGRDKEAAEGLAFLQSIHFERRGRGSSKKKARRY